MCLSWVVSFLALAVANAQELATECPYPNGFFADSRQCDKYYKCADNVLSEKLCPDGMAFNDIDPSVEKCDLLSVVDCTGRSQLQPPKPTPECDRQNGNFAPKDTPNCQQAYRCVDGVSSLITCPEGLAFALETGICDWPDQSGRKDCEIENSKNFSCPRVDPDVAVSHPRYADPHDCQYFYVCINGKIPRRNGCAFGQVFSTNTTTCLTPKEVPECADYYTEYFDEYFLSVEADPSKIRTDIVNAAIAAGYNVPNVRSRVRIQPGSRQPSRREPTTEEVPAPVAEQRAPANPRLRKPGRRPLRRRPGGARPRKRTTTTTTTTSAPDDYYYDYYYDYPEGAESTASTDAVPGSGPLDKNDAPFFADSATSATADASVATDSSTLGSASEPRLSSTRTSLPIRRPFSRP